MCTHARKKFGLFFEKSPPGPKMTFTTLNALVKIPEGYFPLKTKEFNDATRNLPGQLQDGPKKFPRAGLGQIFFFSPAGARGT